MLRSRNWFSLLCRPFAKAASIQVGRMPLSQRNFFAGACDSMWLLQRQFGSSVLKLLEER
jgi:hypothetical protein